MYIYKIMHIVIIEYVSVFSSITESVLRVKRWVKEFIYLLYLHYQAKLITLFNYCI